MSWFKFLLMKGCEWKVICEPSLFPSGCWADKELWGQEFHFPSYWKAWQFASAYISEHPFGKATIRYRLIQTEST